MVFSASAPQHYAVAWCESVEAAATLQRARTQDGAIIMPRHSRAALLVLIGLIGPTVLVACSSGGSTTSATSTLPPSSSAQQTQTPAAGAAGSLQQDFVIVVNKVRPSVVEISTGNALGSGVVYDAKGDIVTNNHVVGNAQQFQVTFFDGETVSASLVGTYPPDDLAVVHVNRSKAVNAAAFADSSKLQVGDIALAIGNPLGLASSVTDGIVSFNGRTVGEGNGVLLPDTVQTSAAINPGNSGGALVNIDAQVIGIPTLAATDPQLGGGAAAGIGFAIPSNTVKLIAPQLISQGKVTNSGRAALGISGATSVDASGQPIGVIVTQVSPGGPADQAGIHVGDVITQINGQPTPTLSALQAVLASLKPGDAATLSIVGADGSHRSVKVTLGNLTGP
jgi:putative serine protease PepD